MQASSTAKANIKVILGLTLVHLTGDFYSSFVTPLLPVLQENLSLTLTEIGFLAGISRLLAFIVQPSVGYLADQYKTRLFVVGGPLVAAIFIPLLGVATGFWTVMFFIAVGSIGSSMFHPPAAGMIPAHAGRNMGLSMSIFNLGGVIAFAIGPLFVTWYVSRFGLPALPFSAAIGVALTGVLWVILPVPEGEGMKRLGFWGSIKDALGPVWKTISLIWLLIVLRTFVSQSFMTFLPIMFAAQGYSLVTIGGIYATYITAAAISGLIAGHLADRIGYKPIFYVTYALATPSLYFFLNAGGQWIYAGAFTAGFITLATMSIAVAMAQELAPRAGSLVASLMMGLAFGTGGFLTPLTGWLADLFSIQLVLGIILWVPLLATALVYRLPGRAEMTRRA